MSKNHLRFVLDNFHLMKIKWLLGDIRQMQYIMAAFYSPESDDSDKQMLYSINKNILNMKDVIKEMQTQIDHINQNQNINRN